jgi:3-phenylpropionate/trans-cinnamate dioxygenase ferredoxin subunit
MLEDTGNGRCVGPPGAARPAHRREAAPATLSAGSTVGGAMKQHAVCRTDDVKKGHMKAFTVAGEKLVVYHLQDGFYATQASCTHVFAPLAKGKILDGCKVQCPFHRARFDIRTGEVIDWANFPPGVQLLNVIRGEKALKTYKVTVREGEVRVAV